jgi:hypothetical protein
MRHAGSSTPNLQRHGESFVGVLLMLVVGVVILVLSASGVFK